MLRFSPIVMVRFSEIAIKSAKTRRWLTERLVSHINFVLGKYGNIDYQTIKEYSRIFVRTNETKKVKNIISSLVPGAVSTSEVFQCSSEIKEIQNCVKMEFFKKFNKGSSFSVKVKRTGKHSFTSIELAAKIGEYILENNHEKDLKVDLTNPQYQLNVEVRDEKAYIFDEINKGLGGLPVGSQGRVLVVVNGEKEDLSNIIQLYKRGALTLIYSIQTNQEIKNDFREAISKLLDLQPQLRQSEKEIHFPESRYDINSLLEYYINNECHGIALSKDVFSRLTNEIPVTLPIFVPHLVTEIDEEEINSLLTAAI